MLKIDSHTHILPKKLPNWSEKFGYGDFIYLQHHKKGAAKMMRGNQFFREIKENSWNAEIRINYDDMRHVMSWLSSVLLRVLRDQNLPNSNNFFRS